LRRRWPKQVRLSRGLRYSFLDQALLSSTTFVLTLVAARAGGAQGLGVVFIGFSAYLIALGISRALVVDPLIALSSALSSSERERMSQSAAGVVLLIGTTVTVVSLVLRLASDSDLAYGLSVFAPWMLPALLQDMARAVAFRDDQGHVAVRADLTWAIATAALFFAAWSIDKPWAIVGAWGLGSCVALAISIRCGVLAAVATPQAAWRWWRAEASRLGRWLAAEGVLYSITMYGTIFVLSVVLSTSAIGGLRAAQSLFAPLSLILPALALPGLPKLARAVANRGDAWAVALKYSVLAASLALGYLILFGVTHDAIAVFFGNDFGRFNSLVWAIGCAQIATALGWGFGLLLKAQLRGGLLFAIRAAALIINCGLTLALASRYGIDGAAWGMAISALLGAVGLVVASRIGAHTSRASDPRLAYDVS
jgi:O-antigen/teichoic acid export membrane protein